MVIWLDSRSRSTSLRNTPSAIGDLQMFPVQTNNTFAAGCLCAFSLCKLTPNDIPNIPGINQKDTQSQPRRVGLALPSRYRKDSTKYPHRLRAAPIEGLDCGPGSRIMEPDM